MMRCLQTVAFLFISFFLSFSAYAGYASHEEYDEERYKNWQEYYGVEFNDQEKSDLYFKAFVSFEDVMGDIIAENISSAGYASGCYQYSLRMKPKENFSKAIAEFVAGKKFEAPKDYFPQQCQLENAHQRLLCYQNILNDYIEKYIFEDFPLTSEHYENDGEGFSPGIRMPYDRYYNRKPKVRKSLAIAQDDFYNLMEALTDKEEDINTLTEWYYLQLIDFFETIIAVDTLDVSVKYFQKRKVQKK